MTVLVGDCRVVLSRFPENFFDAVITDPPYELGFMGKSWDKAGVSFEKETWEAVIRVLKPGGHLLAFGGSRTYHRIVVAIEDAGFEIRDQIMWLYGSGFPKSMNIGKAIESHQKTGKSNSRSLRQTEQEGDGEAYQLSGKNNGIMGEDRVYDRKTYTPGTDAAREWEGWGTALKPAHEPIVVARKPFKGTVANNILTHGTGALNIDGTRISATDTAKFPVGDYGEHGLYGVDGERTDDPNPEGRWPANIIFTHSEGCEQVGTKKIKGRTINTWDDGAKPFGGGAGHDYSSQDFPDEDVGIWDCEPECAVRLLDEENVKGRTSDQQGGPSRFFYTAKVSKKERNHGLTNKNAHPTVKPISLMGYLIRLVTPPGGLILDPFAGSGSTGIAAHQEGFRFLGVEQDPEYAKLARARIKGWKVEE